MKLYKFRSLGSEDDLKWGKKIIETGEFHCSHYWELNDPMEGVYKTCEGKNFIEEIFEEKKQFKICSFSELAALENPIMWGYYSNGFRGYVLEIEINEDHVQEIIYSKEMKYFLKKDYNKDSVKKLLTTKLSNWKHEHEWRFFSTGIEQKVKIGEIKSIYLGNPYEKTANYYNVKFKKNLGEYIKRKNDLIETANSKKLEKYNVEIENNKVKWFK